MFLIDTDILSFLRRRRRHPGVAAWMGRQRASDLFVSVVSIGEIERGIALQHTRDPAYAAVLADWLDHILGLYSDRILPFDVHTSRRWGRLSAALGNDSADLMIAATALEHGLTVVTRNARHFAPTGVATLDPIGAGTIR